MKLTSIKFGNFKSFKRLELELGSFNVLIGANSAGKSNFLQALSFLRDIASKGLENAVSLQGGASYLRNMNLSEGENIIDFEICAEPDKVFKCEHLSDDKHYFFEIYRLKFEFSLKLHKNGGTPEIKRDRIVQYFRTYSKDKSGTLPRKELFDSSFMVEKYGIDFKIEFGENIRELIKEEDLLESFFVGYKSLFKERKLLNETHLQKSLMLETHLYFLPHVENIKYDFSDIIIYDFDPSLPKKAASIAAKSELEESGENLAVVLRNILSDSEKRRMFFNILKEALPFIEDVKVEQYIDKYLLITFREKWSGGRFMPPFMMSEGTIFIMDIIIALYFEKKSIVIFEEPERRIHPFLLSRIIDMMHDASRHKQIFISTHNPEIVKNADPNSIVLISRDKNGFSKAEKPLKHKEIQTFLNNEIGIDELYVQNLLEKPEETPPRPS